MDYPRIGITMYGRNQAGEFPVPANYVEAVLRADGLPLLIPPGEQKADAFLRSIDGLLFTGGGDIDPARYGGNGHDAVYMVNRDRDQLELSMAKLALAQGLPILAVCRGIQVINVSLGGTLFSHLPEVFGDSVSHRFPPREPVPHRLRLEAGSRTSEILGVTECEAMSWHHQAIDRLGDSLRPVGWAPDEVVEAVQIDDNPNLLALQWHPELTADRDPVQQRPFTWLVERARKGGGG
jgi:putative glutamine amidotransferase